MSVDKCHAELVHVTKQMQLVCLSIGSGTRVYCSLRLIQRETAKPDRTQVFPRWHCLEGPMYLVQKAPLAPVARASRLIADLRSFAACLLRAV